MSAPNKGICLDAWKDVIVRNFQFQYPFITDKTIIRKVLSNENWDLEKSSHLLKKLNEDFAKKEKENKKSKSNFDNSSSPQKSKREKVKENKTMLGITNRRTKPNPNPDVKEKKSKKHLKLQQQQQEDINGKVESMIFKCNSKTDIKRLYDFNRRLYDPLDRIVGYSIAGIKVMVFMRGCPGSGKSTYAKEIFKKIGVTDPKWCLFSADDFFIDENTGIYSFNPESITLAHEWNQKLVRQAASEGRSPIVIDNTHTRLWEMKDNARVAVEYGYIIETLEPKTAWFFVESQLFKKTTHNVSRENIRRMIDRYEPNLTGQDIISLLGLTYVRPPPTRQIVDAKARASRKTIQLYRSKNIIKHGEEYPIFTDSAVNYQINNTNTAKHDIYRTNRPDQTFNQPSLSQINSSYTQKSSDDQLQYHKNKMQNNFQTNRPTFNDHPTSSQFIPTATESQLHKINVSQLSEGIAIFDPFSSSKNLGDNEMSQNQIDDDKNSNLTNNDFIDNIVTSYDLIHLNNDESEPTSNDTIPDSLPYYSAYYKYFQNEELSSSEDSLLDNEDEDDFDDDDDEDMNNEDDLVDSLDEIKRSSNSSSSSIELETDSKENLINECNEYVLIMKDETILFQKEHQNFPTNLNDFKHYCPTENIQSSIVSVEKEQLAEIENNKNSNNFITQEYVLIQPDKTLLCQKIHNNKPENMKDVFKKPERNLDKTLNKTFEQFVQTEDKSGNEIKTTGDSNPVKFINKSVSTEVATADADNVFGVKVMEASSNTNYIDFEILKQINILDNASNGRKDVIIGRPIFESVPFTNYNSKQVPSVLMLDKSSMTCDVQTNQISNTNIGVDSLIKLFPNIKRENLEELLNRCNKDLDWAVGLLLDSGHEMSEYIPVMEQSETTVVNDEPSTSNHLNIPVTTTVSCPTINNSTNDSPKKVIYSDKKKKKKNVTLDDDSLDLLLHFQDKFKLNDEHYSENIMKLRRHKLLINDESQPTTSQEYGLLKTNEDLLDMMEEEGIEEEESCEEIEEEEEESDKENDVALVMDKNLVIQLQNKFGGLLSPNLIGDKTILHIPKNLARQLYCYTFDAVYEQLEQQQAVIDMLINEGVCKDDIEKERLQNQPSFQEIMDHEVALRMSQVKDSSRANTAASALSRTLLLERFPNVDTSTLSSILEETNHSLHAATNLLTLAGHSTKSEETQAAKKEENIPLSRDEAIQQAQAYSDIAGKLYDMREDCLSKAENALAEGKKTVAQYYSEMAKWYMERIEHSNSLAASAMLNGREGATTLDLHFLQVNEALKVLDLFLDDKIRSLLNKRKITVYIITGRGSHSPRGLCKIKQAVQTRLRKRQISFIEQNPGMLRAYITKKAIVSYKKLLP